MYFKFQKYLAPKKVTPFKKYSIQLKIPRYDKEKCEEKKQSTLKKKSRNDKDSKLVIITW